MLRRALMVLLFFGAVTITQAADQDSRLRESAIRGDLGQVQELLRAGARVDAKDKNGATALYFAALNGHIDLVRCLLDNKAEIDVTSSSGFTPLMIASQEGHVEVVRLLINRGANVNFSAQDNVPYGGTPLLLAATMKRTDVARVLLEQGADPNARDTTDCTPLMIAAGNGDIALVTLLLEKKVDINGQQASTGATALTNAIVRDQTGVAQLLLARGAQFDLKQNGGLTPLALAKMLGRLEIVRMLERAGAAGKTGAGPDNF